MFSWIEALSESFPKSFILSMKYIVFAILLYPQYSVAYLIFPILYSLLSVGIMDKCY